MKLIIDIPEEIYKASKIIDVQYEDIVQTPFEVIAKGIPLDKLRTEIEREADYQDAYVNADVAKGMYLALEIINKMEGDNK